MIKVNLDINLSDKPHKRVKTPSILQMDAMECGAVSLSIILAYFGLHLPSETVREACGVTRDGSKAINIIKAARNLGMDAEGKRLFDINSLRCLPTPFIVFWEFNHFLVVEGIVKNKVYLNDPAIGPRVIPLEEFDKKYTGVVLCMTPGENFKPYGKKEKSVFGLLREYLKGDFRELTYLILISALLSIPQASLAMFIQFFIDNIVIKNQYHWMPGFVIGMGLTLLIMGFILWIQQYYLVLYKIRFSIKQVPNFFYKVLHLPMSFYIQRATGDISNRLSLFDEISTSVTTSVSKVIIDSFSILIFLVIIFLINTTIGLITLLVSVLNLMTIIVTKRIIIDLGRRFSQDQAKMHSIEYSGVQMIESLKYMNGENRFFSRWFNHKAKLIQSQQTIEVYSSFISLLPQVLYFLNLVVLIILGAHFVLNGTMSVGGIIAIYTLLLLFPQSVISIVENFLKINELKASLIRINDVLLHKKPKEKIQKKRIKTSNLVDIKKLYFGYSTLEAPILADINISLKKGHTLAITGISGGGKSSLLNLITGLFEPWYGAIYLEGRNINDYQSAELFKLVSYVDQNIFLFDGTIRDNLTMWDNSIDEATIIEALHNACVYDVVALKGGLDYRILEGGSNISLGQAQRIEIARALIKKPALILLDEATSALDSVTEAKIYQNLSKINCSFIIVAHRLSAIKHCNEIIVVEEGGIVERGSHQELIQLNGRYRQFIEKDDLL